MPQVSDDGRFPPATADDAPSDLEDVGADRRHKSPNEVESLNPRLPAAHRRLKFAREYISNGHNGKQAAIAVGYAGHSAESMASTLLRDPKVQAHVAMLARRYAEKADLTIENTLLEVRRIAFMNANDFIAEDGSPVPAEDWSPAMGACVRKIKWGAEGKIEEIQFWDKNQALTSALKHLGLFEQNNLQKAHKSRSLEIVFVPGPKRDTEVVGHQAEPERMKLPSRVRRDPTGS